MKIEPLGPTMNDEDAFFQVGLMNTPDLLETIGRLQNIQKAHPPTHPEWIKASTHLQPLFREMARRQKRG